MGQNVYLEVTNVTSFDYKLFNKFYILTYSDLKKYKFYYWVAYPILSNTWTVESESQETDTTITQLVETELDNEYGQFFQYYGGKLHKSVQADKEHTFVFIDTCLSKDRKPSSQLKTIYISLRIRELKK